MTAVSSIQWGSDMATPNGIRFRLLTVQNDELVRIITALKATRPMNMAELLETVRELQDELKAALTALDRAAVASDQQSDGDA